MVASTFQLCGPCDQRLGDRDRGAPRSGRLRPSTRHRVARPAPSGRSSGAHRSARLGGARVAGAGRRRPPRPAAGRAASATISVDPARRPGPRPPPRRPPMSPAGRQPGGGIGRPRAGRGQHELGAERRAPRLVAHPDLGAAPPSLDPAARRSGREQPGHRAGTGVGRRGARRLLIWRTPPGAPLLASAIPTTSFERPCSRRSRTRCPYSLIATPGIGRRLARRPDSPSAAATPSYCEPAAGSSSTRDCVPPPQRCSPGRRRRRRRSRRPPRSPDCRPRPRCSRPPRWVGLLVDHARSGAPHAARVDVAALAPGHDRHPVAGRGHGRRARARAGVVAGG